MARTDLGLSERFALVDQRCEAKRALREQQYPKRPSVAEGRRVPCRGLTKRLRLPCKALSEPGTKRCRWHTPKGPRVVCGACRRRDGLPCKARSVSGKARCRWHGGASTGPRTREGQLRALANLRQFVRLKTSCSAEPSGRPASMRGANDFAEGVDAATYPKQSPSKGYPFPPPIPLRQGSPKGR